jgi:hypothetical protein
MFQIAYAIDSVPRDSASMRRNHRQEEYDEYDCRKDNDQIKNREAFAPINVRSQFHQFQFSDSFQTALSAWLLL